MNPLCVCLVNCLVAIVLFSSPIFLYGCGQITQEPDLEEILVIGSKCRSSNECLGGTTCFKGVCSRLCRLTEDCQGGFVCQNGICDRCNQDNECLGGFRCQLSTGRCYSSCQYNSQCRDGYYCYDDNYCVLKNTKGTACENDAECLTGFCRDGYCCDQSCDGVCMTCKIAGLEGFCNPVPRGQNHILCPPVQVSCTADNSTPLKNICNGQGQCLPTPDEMTCAPYRCAVEHDSAFCRSSCRDDTQCAQGFHCFGGQCEESKQIGEECLLDNQCQSTHCRDGFCCDSSCEAGDYKCNRAGKEGRCGKD